MPSLFSRLRGTLSPAVPAGLIVASLVIVPALVLSPRGMPRYQALREELGVLRERNARLERRVVDLTAEVRALGTDPAAVERVARDELGMVRPGELVFEFPRPIPPRAARAAP